MEEAEPYEEGLKYPTAEAPNIASSSSPTPREVVRPTDPLAAPYVTIAPSAREAPYQVIAPSIRDSTTPRSESRIALTRIKSLHLQNQGCFPQFIMSIPFNVDL
jgi:hypothetical protein